jgi:hypothetical protein
MDVTVDRGQVRRLFAAFVMAGLFLFSPRVRGDEPFDEVRRLRLEAQRAANEGRPAAALKVYEALFRATGGVWDACNAGRLAYHMDRALEAFELLDACVRLGTPQEPKLTTYEKGTLAGARSELIMVRARVGRVWVIVSKPGAEVSIDGRKIGTSPILREVALDPGEHQITASLGGESANARVKIDAGEMKRVDLEMTAPRPSAPKPDGESKANEPTPTVAPQKSAEPLDVARIENIPSQNPPMRQGRTWPAVLVWTAAGVSVVGAGVAFGSYTAARNAANDADASFYTANAFGCYGAAAECSKFDDAHASVNTAGAVGDWALGISSVVAGGLLTTALWGVVTDPVEVQAAPTVGGIVFRGKF